MVGTKSRSSVLNWPGARTEKALHQTVKKQCSAKYLSQKVVSAVFTSQVKGNWLLFLSYSDFWFLPCSNPYVVQKAILLSPTEIATLCGQNSTCTQQAQQGIFSPSEVSIQVRALSYQNGQSLWTANSIAYKGAASQILAPSLALVQPQQNTLLVNTGSPLLTALDVRSGHKLWQLKGSEKLSVIVQMVATA